MLFSYHIRYAAGMKKETSIFSADMKNKPMNTAGIKRVDERRRHKKRRLESLPFL